MLIKIEKIKNFYLKHKLFLFAILALIIPLIFYLLTLERKLIGGDTSWYMIELPQMFLLPPTGYPVFSLTGKLFSIIPVGPLALRLNLISAVFGSLTILFLFMSINKLIKNEFLSLIASLSFAFVYPYWFYANRLEFDTLNSFYIALLLFAIFKYQENQLRKNLYFCFACLGLLLTNHPIAFFIMPAFLILILTINIKIFKSIKVIFLSILFFILPLFSYSYIYIRSKQGFGKANTLLKFIYFVTGREESGRTFGGSFGDKHLRGILKVMLDYLKLIKNNYGIILVIIAVIGFIYLCKKNWKIASFLLLAIVFNLIITTQYLDWAVLNYTLNIMLIMSVYTGFGFLFFTDLLKILFNKLSSKENKKAFNLKTFKYFSFIVLFLLFASLPVLLITNNYEKCNLKKPSGIYLFWDNAYKSMDKNAKLYVYTASTNIGIFIGKFEQKEKNIQIISNNDAEYNFENIIKQVSGGTSVYFIGNDASISKIFVTEKIGKPFYWDRYNENLQLYKITKAEPRIKIKSIIKSQELKFGKEIVIEYKIKNNSNDVLKINSIELKLPEGLKFAGVLSEGYIKQNPGISRGMYMWVSDNYIITAGNEINLVFKIIPTKTGNFSVKLKLTTYGIYFDAEDLLLKIN
jgi:hypothetical protein